ncbi:MAG: UDP-N-acetylglucosamine 1-carboxyvinyltransferase [Candidatus Ryanbacteria bacterium RIFCSPLOWO2_02_FULL_45_11c]|uniref:UDP-N-acetylglucosamine 1-carboxyvinyltransferase n=1 Tax=Candidatus Ryanbacteria bacterium RIFCSPLOWO2_02_FULL_45_11c TaxID=1802128 RepID=A0A1G2GUF6_9BACT|nr:MAG: UDP-N-acetylglucosamine 1-carboxyvinyltransferase [Candidatus Ryanbacteria bacterium RIFCSPLOWO2_02_FULL_45_11c]
MSRFIIHGGRTLSGEISVRGAKNHALKLFPASILSVGPIIITGVPDIEDIFCAGALLRELGFKVIKQGDSAYKISSPSDAISTVLKEDIAERIRASILFAGPLLARAGRVRFPFPGGCVIGRRPIDLFLDGWVAMGAKVREHGTVFDVSAAELHGADIPFRVVSHTATESLLMTAVLARGNTVLRNAALEPEIIALATFLNTCGARIRGAGTPTIYIEGTNGKLLKGGMCRVIPDRIETGSFAILGALLGKRLRITNCQPEHVAVLLEHLRAAGVSIHEGKDWIEVSRPSKLNAVSMRTREYPGFATDHQAPFVVLLTQAHGQAMVFETVFEGRLSYLADLNRMGADIIQCDLHRAIISGPTRLRGRSVESPDLRAGMAFVIAALVARGTSQIGNVYQIDRGYEKLDERLRALGADIVREA